MDDLAIRLDDRPGALAELAETLGAAGISIEGGGVFVVDDTAIAHFLFKDAAAAARVLRTAGFEVGEPRTPIIRRIDQDTPGQLGQATRSLAAAGANIAVMYSDHDGRLILVVDDATAVH